MPIVHNTFLKIGRWFGSTSQRLTFDLVQQTKCPTTNMTDNRSCIICQRQSYQALHNVTLVGLNSLITTAKDRKKDDSTLIRRGPFLRYSLNRKTVLMESTLLQFVHSQKRVMNLLRQNAMLEKNHQSPKNLSVL